MNERGRAALPALLILLSLAACGDATGPDPDRAPAAIETLPRALTASELAVIDGSNAFSIDVWRTVEAADDSPNVFLSGLSASMALGMTMSGTSGRTWDDMRATLRLGELTEEEINASYRDLIKLLLELDPRVDIGIANATFAADDFAVRQDFLDRLREYFDAEAGTLDFQDPSSVGVVNAWAAEKTNDLIDELLQSWRPAAVLALLNALYFKGDWTEHFDRDTTAGRPFTLPSGETAQVETMRSDEALLRVGHHSETGATIGELPYGGRAFVMDIVLPPKGTSLDAFVAGLDADDWDRLVASLSDGFHRGIVQLPRLEIEYEKVLNGELIDLGMAVAFGKGAVPPDSSRLGPGDLAIGLVKQKSFVRVDEEGTEAAAVTVVVVVESAEPPTPTFIVDRPYLFALRERLSGTILFVGTVRDPRG
jgi:serpin B